VSRSRRELENSSCSLNSKELYYDLAVKKLQKIRKKSLINEYEKAKRNLEKKADILRVEKERHRKALIRHQSARQKPSNYIFIVAGVPEEHHGSAYYEFDLNQNIINIFFGSTDGRPKGKGHRHRIIDALTCERKYAPDPNEPRPPRSSQKPHEKYDADDREYCIQHYGTYGM
jgi:hypothetical protein